MTAAPPPRPLSATTSGEWLQNLNLLFKNYDESFLKSPLFFGGAPHVVPEKIIDTCLDPNTNVRVYRIKWLDSWLTEHVVASVFPHLITDYWINKQILNEPLDFQTPIETNTTRTTIPQINLHGLQGNEITKGQRQETNVVSENTPTQSSTATQSLTLPQLFSNVAAKENYHHDTETISAQNNKHIESEFTVENSLTVSERLNNKNLRDAKKSGDLDAISSHPPVSNNISGTQISTPSQLQPPTNKNNEQSVVLYLDRNLTYSSNVHEERNKAKPINKLTSQSFDNSGQLMQHQLPLPSMEQIQQLNDQIATQMQQIPLQTVTTEKKQTTPKKTPSAKPAKPLTGRRVPNMYKNPVQCDICFKTISSKKNLRIHKTVKHFKNGSFSCHICGRNFALNRDLQRHMPLHTNERNYVCQYCGLQCKQPGHLTKHIRTHTEVMNWRCDCCFKTFRVQSDLKAHCFNDHKDITEKNINCSVCKEKLKLPNSVYLHSLRHSGVREFECPICKATFKLKQHMQVHMKTHEKSNNQESHQCPICMKLFRSKALCAKHKTKHEEKTAQEFQERSKDLRKVKEKSNENDKSKKVITSSTDDDFNLDDDKSTKRKQKLPSKILAGKDDPAKKKRVNGDLICTYCSEVFDTRTALVYHVKIVHEDDRTELLNSGNYDRVSDESKQTSVINTHNDAILMNGDDDDERTDLRLPEFTGNPPSSSHLPITENVETPESLTVVEIRSALS